MVAVYWGAGDEVAYDDGEHYAAGMSDRYVYWELTRRPEVFAWLWGHEVNLGNSEEPPTHVLLVDQAEERAYITPFKKAIDKLKTQRLEE